MVKEDSQLGNAGTLFGADPSKLNPYGADQSDVQDYQKALQDSIKALEDRYAQPNWFKVAAGFAKPQLGGFTASLGSAAGALGDWQEQQRAAELPISQMRANLAQTKILMGQKQKAADLADVALQQPGGVTAKQVAAVRNLDKDRGDYLQEQFTNEGNLRDEILRARQAGRSDAELAAKYGNEFKRLFPSGVPNTYAPVPQYGKQPGQGNVEISEPSKPPIGFNGTAEEWQNMPLEKQIAVRSNLEEKRQGTAQEQESNYRTQAENASQMLPTLTALHELASKPNMQKILGIFENGDVLGAVGKAVESGSFPKLLETARNQVISAAKDPQDISDFNTLMGLVAKVNLGVRQGQLNPSNYTTEIDTMAGPGITDPQDAFLRKTALAQHDMSHRVQTYKAYKDAVKAGVPASDFIGSDPYNKLESEYQAEHARRATTPYPTLTSAKAPAASANKPQSSTPPAAPATPSALTHDAIKAAIERKKKLAEQQP